MPNPSFDTKSVAFVLGDASLQVFVLEKKSTCRMMARHLSLGRTFGIFVPLSNPHFGAVDDPLAIYEYLVWHGFRLQPPGGDQIRSFGTVQKIAGFMFWSCVSLPAKTTYIYILFFVLLRGGLDDFLLNSDRTLEKKWSNLRLARIGGGSTDHLFIYDLSLENYLKVGVFKMEIPFVSEKNVTVYILCWWVSPSQGWE